MDTLKDWRCSPFENEGASQSGLRSALCAKGHRWILADLEARAIISECFRRMGVQRPTWEQGQREFVEPLENCVWCGGLIPDALRAGKVNIRFCSSICAKGALEHKAFRERRQSDEIYASVFAVIQKERNPERRCDCCGTAFRPMFAGGRFCSQPCSAKAARYVPERSCKGCGQTFRPRHMGLIYCSRKCAAKGRTVKPEHRCLYCGTSFRPAGSNLGKYCSRACSDSDRKNVEYRGVCLFCYVPFVAKSPKAKCCSQLCAQYHSKEKAGKWKPAKITALIFDHFCGVPRPAIVTADLFDSWFAEAA